MKRYIPHVSEHARRRAHERVGGCGISREQWRAIVDGIREGSIPWRSRGHARLYDVPVYFGDRLGVLPIVWDPRCEIVVTVLNPVVAGEQG